VTESNISNIVEFYRIGKKFDYEIVYNGPPWSDSIEGLGRTLKKRMESDELLQSVSRSVFSVFVEQMNNMLMYSEDRQALKTPDTGYADVPQGIFILGTRDNKYYVQSGNIIKNKNASYINEIIARLKVMDKNSLRKYYKEQLKTENQNPDSKGAGLGLIEMARRASAPIEYCFFPYEKDYTFYTILVTIA
jgi:hypothetical protein